MSDMHSTPTPCFDSIEERAEALERLSPRALLLIDALISAYKLGNFDAEAPALLEAYYAGA